MLIKHVVIRIKNICYNFKHEIKAGGNVMISYWKKMMKGKVFLICFTLSVAIVAYMIYSASFYRKLSNGDYLFGVLAVAIFTFMLRVLARMIALDKINDCP